MSSAFRNALIFLALPLVAFADTSWRPITLPDGTRGYSIRCDEGINACYEVAGDVCHRGYSLLNTSMQSGFKQEGGGYAGPGIVPGTAVAVSSTSAKSTADNGLVIQCKDPEVTEYERTQRMKARQEEQDRRSRRDGRIVMFIAAGIAAVGIVFLSIALVTK